MGLYYRLDYKKNKKEVDRNEPVSVVIDYYHKGSRTKISTGVSCLVKDWDEKWRNRNSKNPIKSTDKDYRNKNLLIKNKLDEINRIIRSIQKEDKEPIVELVRGYLSRIRREKEIESRKDIHFLPLFTDYEKWIDSTYNPQRNSTKRGVLSSIKQIREYTTEFQSKHKKLLFPDEIDRDWLYGFIKWSYDKKGLKPTTINKRIKVLSHFSNWSKERYNTSFQIKKPKGIHLNDNGTEVVFLKRDEVLKLFHFDKFDIKNPEHTKVLGKENRLNYINDTWVDRWGNERKKTYTSFEVYKDMLIFLCNIGCRYGDMVKMKLGDFEWDKERDDLGRIMGYFSFFMEKIKIQREPVKVRMNGMLYEIWKKYSSGKSNPHYLFPRTKFDNPISNQKYNNYIKEICEIVGLKRSIRVREWNVKGEETYNSFVPLCSVVTSHIGRRTFIREHIELGTPIRSIMRMTGHRSQRVFDSYYNVLDKDILTVNDKLFQPHYRSEKHPEKLEEKPQDVKKITPEIEEQLKTLLRMKEIGTLPEDIWRERVKKLIS